MLSTSNRRRFSWTSKLLDITKFPSADGAILGDSRDCKVVEFHLPTDSSSSIETQTVQLIPQGPWQRIKCAFNNNNNGNSKVNRKKQVDKKNEKRRSVKDSLRILLLNPLTQKRNSNYENIIIDGQFSITKFEKTPKNQVEPFDAQRFYRLEDDLLLENFNEEDDSVNIPPHHVSTNIANKQHKFLKHYHNTSQHYHNTSPNKSKN